MKLGFACAVRLAARCWRAPFPHWRQRRQHQWRKRAPAGGRFRLAAIGPDSDSLQRSSRLRQARPAQAGPRSGRARARRDDLRAASLDVRADGRDGFVRSRPAKTATFPNPAPKSS